MPISTKARKWLGAGLALLVLAFVFVVVRTWVVPALIVRAIQGEVEGKVTIRDWWVNGRSGGVVGLIVHEGAAADSAVAATAERVTTDLSLGALLRGRFTPGRITLERALVSLRVDESGRVLNLPTLKEGRKGSRLPAVTANAARVVFHREGKSKDEDMVISGVDAQLQPDSSGRTLKISGGTDDSTWGRWNASGSIQPEDHRGEVRLTGARVEADPKTLARVPFIPAEVWTHVVPRGPVRVEVRLDWATGRTPEFQAKAEVVLLGASARFPTLGLAADGASGTLRVDGGLVQVDQVQGQALGGRVEGVGTLDFGRTPPRINLDLNLSKVKVEDTPKLWQLDKAGITGLLTGSVKLRAQLHPSGVDLSGTTGTATVENASIQGIPVKSLHLAMSAKGDELEYDADSAHETRVDRFFRLLTAARTSLRAFGPTLAQGALVALQAPADPDKPDDDATTKSEEQPRKFAVKLPKTISTDIELEDVDVAELIAKAQFLAAFPFPVPVTGKLSLKAKATIPLGAMSDVKQYAFHGDLTLKSASVFKVDFSHLTARLELENGILDLKHLRGLLIDRPDGGPDNPPRLAATEVPAEGPLPSGGFRGDLRAEISPPGTFTARFEGSQLPMGELSAPLLPRPTPLAGLASMNLEARTDLARANDPAAWTVTGKAESRHITYRNSVLEHVALQFQLKEGRLDLPSLTALMAGHPLTIKGELDLKPPLAYHATLDVDDWDLATIAAFVPNAPQPSPVTGALSAHAVAEGTLSPWTITTDGRGRVDRFVAGPVPLGEVPFRWSTDRDSILISDVEARPFGGRLSAEAHIPVAGGGAAEGTATIRDLDTARLSASIPGEGLKLTGRAEGSIAFAVPKDGAGVDANVRISSRDLTFQGIPAEQVRASVRAQQGVLKYEVTADSLGGKLKVLGDIPLTSARVPGSTTPAPPRVANGEVRLDGFTLDQIWKSFKVVGDASLLSGQGAINANVRSVLAGTGVGLWVHGIVELRNLKWGKDEPIGQLRGIVAKSPTAWRVEPLSGELLGGATNGALWGRTTSRESLEAGFNLRVERASLNRMLAFAPSLSPHVSGLGTLQASGRLDENLRAEVALNAAKAQFLGMPVSELQAPLELVFTPSTGTGAVQIRHVSARVSGGQVRGDGSFRIGANRSFQGQVQLTDLDLQTLHRLASDSSRLSSGRISGRITLSGPDPSLPERYRGRVNLDLDDAALFSIPVFREVEKFFGSARGGLFEDGDLVGTIANRQLIIETLSLQGRIVQLHVTGTVGFDTQLNLEVLVNTSQLIPETGQALLARIPGLKDVLGRNEQAFARVATFLSNRLVKLRVTGTLRNPSVAVDASVLVAETAVAFFSGVLKLPLGFIR